MTYIYHYEYLTREDCFQGIMRKLLILLGLFEALDVYSYYCCYECYSEDDLALLFDAYGALVIAFPTIPGGSIPIMEGLLEYEWKWLLGCYCWLLLLTARVV